MERKKPLKENQDMEELNSNSISSAGMLMESEVSSTKTIYRISSSTKILTSSASTKPKSIKKCMKKAKKKVMGRTNYQEIV